MGEQPTPARNVQRLYPPSGVDLTALVGTTAMFGGHEFLIRRMSYTEDRDEPGFLTLTLKGTTKFTREIKLADIEDAEKGGA